MVGRDFFMANKDPDEAKLEHIARRVLAMPPKPQSEMRIGKREKPAAKPAKKKGG